MSETPPVAAPVSPKSGIYTTEFWNTLIITIAGAFVFVWGAIHGDKEMAGIGAMVAGVPSSIYTIVRGKVKA